MARSRQILGGDAPVEFPQVAKGLTKSGLAALCTLEHQAQQPQHQSQLHISGPHKKGKSRPDGAGRATRQPEPDRKSTRLKLQSRPHLVCRLLLEKKKK